MFIVLQSFTWFAECIPRAKERVQTYRTDSHILENRRMEEDMKILRNKNSAWNPSALSCWCTWCVNWQLARRKDFTAKWGTGILHVIAAAAVKMTWETNRKSPELKMAKMRPGQTFQRMCLLSFIKEKVEKQLDHAEEYPYKKENKSKIFLIDHKLTQESWIRSEADCSWLCNLVSNSGFIWAPANSRAKNYEVIFSFTLMISYWEWIFPKQRWNHSNSLWMDVYCFWFIAGRSSHLHYNQARRSYSIVGYCLQKTLLFLGSHKKGFSAKRWP